jgi:hypothetical protein
MQHVLALLFCFGVHAAGSQDSTHLKVHLFYGSRPHPEFKDEERKYFGGLWGGHVSIGWDNDRHLSFLHNGKFHWFPRKHKKHSRYLAREMRRYKIHREDDPSPMKQATVIIPISARQKEKLDSIADAYLAEPPYDYAFFGMRCAAATYEILGQLGVVEDFGFRTTWIKMFYPRPLRKRLFRLAEKHGWKVERNEGSTRRKWDWDYVFP